MKKLEPGQPAPYGAQLQADGVNFCLFSAHAEKIELCLFDASGSEQRLTLPGRTGNFWHGFLPGAKAGQHYGYRVYGPFEPKNGLRFNPKKLLIDPSARALEGQLRDNARLSGGIEAPDEKDSAVAAPKSVVVDDTFDWGDDAPPATPWGETIIYEAHVRGLTRQHPHIPAALRGTYAGLAHPVMLEHLQHLGVTAIELLPVQHHADEPRLQRLGLSNYWGYNVLAPCAVEPSYASSQKGVSALNEFKAAVKGLHQAGIEVILDVVFNHSAELDVDGPFISFRGLDNPSWYWLREDGSDDNVTGCGNALRLVDDETVAWTLDCLRYWVRECHVDGFRFDLATVLGRTPTFNPDSPLFAAIRADSLLSGVKLIAEPWDIGQGGYQLSNFPPPFAEWSDVWRDDMRKFWLHGDVPLGQFARRFAASADLFDHHDRGPHASINMLTAHDGFTLRDVVSFNDKHNQANGEENRDGHNENYSQNHGEEGLNASEPVLRQRRLSQRALLATLLLSQGTPMLLAGDEHGNSQQGNNNAYCQDNALTWLDWKNADDSLTAYVAALVALRKNIPALTQDKWWRSQGNDVEWLDAQGQPMEAAAWEHGPQQWLQIRLSGSWLLVLNASLGDVDMQLPEGRWQPVAPFNSVLFGEEPQCVRDGSTWRAAAKTLCVLHCHE
ncbi:MAG: glycogen debranching protein GlgX [Ewingella sp.]